MLALEQATAATTLRRHASHAGGRGMTLAVLAMALGLLAPTSALASSTGRISGKVTDANTTLPIEGIEVCAYEAGSEFGEFPSERCSTTTKEGEYTITSLPSGSYKVEFLAPPEGGLNYITQYYNGASSLETATAVAVSAGATTVGINAQMKIGGKLSGKVTDASTHIALKGIFVCAIVPSREIGDCVMTDTSGEYTISGLAGGKYKVLFGPGGSTGGYITQYYNGASSLETATTVTVTVEQTTSEINAQMQVGGKISGTVTNAATGSPLKGVFVCALVSSTEPAGCELTNSSGQYTIEGLPSGQYRVGFDAGKNFQVQYYNNKSSYLEAQPVSVLAPNAITSINAALLPTGTAVPANSVAPQITGTAAVGSTLTCSNGGWKGNPTTYAYAWLRDGVPVPNAIGSTYQVQSTDEGHSLSCQVTAKNVLGEKSAMSASLAIPVRTPPTPVVSLRQSKLLLSGKTVQVHLRCEQATCSGTVKLTLRIISRRHRTKRTITTTTTLVLGKEFFSLAAGENGVVKLRVSAAARKRLKHARHHPLTAELIVSLQGGKTVNRSLIIR
jgi:hypothetical protein